MSPKRHTVVLTPSPLKVHNYIHLHVGEVCLGAALSLGLRVRSNPTLHPHVLLPCGQRPGLTFVRLQVPHSRAGRRASLCGRTLACAGVQPPPGKSPRRPGVLAAQGPG